MEWSFASEPSRCGWTTGHPANLKQTGCTWSPEGYAVVKDGWWAGPPVDVVPFSYYRVSYESRGDEPGFCFVEFLPDGDEQLSVDCCDGVEPSADWQRRQFVFRAHARARRAMLRFQDRSGPYQLRCASIKGISEAEALEWLEGLLRQLPEFSDRFDETRWARLSKTLSSLRRGARLRIVLLGDSIVNDTANSLFELLLRKVYPNAEIQVVSSVRSSTGCWYYREPGRVREYVLRYEPDLAIIGGISHGYNAEAVRDVVRQIRAERDVEFILMTGAVAPYEREKELPYGLALARVADEEGAAFLDMRSCWDGLLAKLSGTPELTARLMRDPIHASSLGKAALGRILAAFLSP